MCHYDKFSYFQPKMFRIGDTDLDNSLSLKCAPSGRTLEDRLGVLFLVF